ncbi:hypothetical protein GCM10027203_39750 [Nonomuraea fastidiosa]
MRTFFTHRRIRTDQAGVTQGSDRDYARVGPRVPGRAEGPKSSRGVPNQEWVPNQAEGPEFGPRGPESAEGLRLDPAGGRVRMDRAGQFPQICPARSAAVQAGVFPQKRRRSRTLRPAVPLRVRIGEGPRGQSPVLLTCYYATETNATVAS